MERNIGRHVRPSNASAISELGLHATVITCVLGRFTLLLLTWILTCSEKYAPSRDACIVAAERVLEMLERGVELDDAFLNFSRAHNLAFIATTVCFMALCHEAWPNSSEGLTGLVMRGVNLLE